MTDHSLAIDIAKTIMQGFDRHFSLFRDITQGAKQRFETADWQGDEQARKARITYYDERVLEAIEALHQDFTLKPHNEAMWRQVKLQFMGLLYEHRQPELAESFYNSVYCKIFDRKYFNHAQIFVRPGLSTAFIDIDDPVYTSYYPRQGNSDKTISTLLKSFELDLPWEDFERDAKRLKHAFAPSTQCAEQNVEICQLQVLQALFFRNKAAYIVGRTLVGGEISGCIIPILRSETGTLYVDTLLTDPDMLAIVFSYTRAYFMVDSEVPSALVQFLQSILAKKTPADLYSAIGFHKQGKTLFFREYLNHLSHSSDDFIIAPGIEGMVMSVFTLPSYPYVFKIIKDKFAPPKKITRERVKEQYHYVKTHDRVGRMADTLEFSHVAFPLDRITPDLLEHLKQHISNNLTFEDDKIIIRHLYIERRMIPFNLFLNQADDDALEIAVIEYGNAIKELIKANIFPGDMLLKNFGVTRQNRVVFYDYDEIMRMTDVRIRRIPPPRTPEQEMATEPWYRVEDTDFFPEQFVHFVMSHPKVHQLLLKYHADIITPEYWQAVRG